MVSKSTNINKENNHFNEHKKDDELGYWKSRSCLGTGTNMRRYWVSIPLLLITGSSTAIYTPHAINKMNDNININSTIAESVSGRS